MATISQIHVVNRQRRLRIVCDCHFPHKSDTQTVQGAVVQQCDKWQRSVGRKLHDKFASCDHNAGNVCRRTYFGSIFFMITPRCWIFYLWTVICLLQQSNILSNSRRFTISCGTLLTTAQVRNTKDGGYSSHIWDLCLRRRCRRW